MFGWLFGKSNNQKSNDNKSNKDTGVFGIDWDGDGVVSEFDDFITIDEMTCDEGDYE